MKTFVNNIHRGALFFSAGGGGDLSLGGQLCRKFEKSEIELYTGGDLKDDDLLIPISGIGSSDLIAENMDALFLYKTIIDKITSTVSSNNLYLLPIFASGPNLLFTMAVSHALKMPLYDGDLTGRVFSDVDINTLNVLQTFPEKSFFTNSFGNCLELSCNQFTKVEDFARQFLVPSGGYGVYAFSPMPFSKIKHCIIKGMVSRVNKVGKLLNHRNLAGLLQYTKGKIICYGVVSNISYDLSGKYIRTIISIHHPKTQKTYKVLADNEILAVKFQNSTLTASPDIITMLNASDLAPVSLDDVRIGSSLIIHTTQAPDIWYTPKGLSITGYRYFSDEVD